jgi:hypothetical protein
MQRNKKALKEKKILQAKRNLEAAEKANVEANKAYATEVSEISGYIRKFELSPLTKMRADAHIFEEILQNINNQQYSQYNDFKDREPLKFKTLNNDIHDRCLQDPEWKPYFEKYFEKLDQSWTQIRETPNSTDLKPKFHVIRHHSHIFHWKWEAAFSIVVTPLYADVGYYGLVYANSHTTKKIAEAEKAFELLGGDDAWCKIHYGYDIRSDSEWKTNVHIAKMCRQSQYGKKTRNIKNALRTPIRNWEELI